MKWSDLKDKPVITVAGGERLGFVDDLLLDAGGRQILGLRTRTDGLLTRHAAMVWGSVHAVGEQAVTVRDASALNEEASFSDLKDARPAEGIVGSRVFTVSGQELGRVVDLCLDLSSRKVLSYALGVGIIDRLRGEERLIPVTQVRSIGDDVVVVEEPTVAQTV
jgi:sporulation protein YlmC with PRC-barrel domain